MKQVDDKTASRNGADAAAEGTRAGCAQLAWTPAGSVRQQIGDGPARGSEHVRTGSDAAQHALLGDRQGCRGGGEREAVVRDRGVCPFTATRNTRNYVPYGLIRGIRVTTFTLAAVALLSFGQTVSGQLTPPTLTPAESLPTSSVHPEAVPAVTSDIRAIGLALLEYRGAFGGFPREDRVAGALLGENPKHQSFLDVSPWQIGSNGELLDVWGRPYTFKIIGNDGVEVRSAGPNGIMGDDDDAWKLSVFVDFTPTPLRSAGPVVGITPSPAP